MIKSRIISVLASAACAVGVLACFPASVGAEVLSTEYTDGNLNYRKVDSDEDGLFDFVRITGCVNGATNVNIPSTEDGLPVRAYDPGCFNDNSSLTEITVSDTNNFFSSKDGILFSKDQNTIYSFPIDKPVNSYTIPNSVSIIGSYAFSSCERLKTITLSQGAKEIGSNAFSGCTALADISIPSSVRSVGYNAFSNTEMMKNQYINKTGPLYYADNWVIDCDSNVTTIIADSNPIKEGTKGIADYTFKDCSSLTEISIPSSVNFIGDSAFAGCTSLAEITIPENVASIGSSAFSNCSSFVKFTIPNSVTSIGSKIFSGCTKLNTITLSSKLSSIGELTFYGCSSLLNIDVPESVKIIGERAFDGCDALKSITIRNKDCNIYQNASTISNTQATIYGLDGSTAQNYANNYNRVFETISSVKEIIGDADGNGKVNIVDAAFIAKKIAQRRVSDLPACSDYNRNGKIDITDAASIAKDIAKRIL